VIAELLTEHITLKKDCREKLKVQWVFASTSNPIVDFTIHLKQRSWLTDNWFFQAFSFN